jgi:Ca2+-binding RTX toxin-like protein
MKNVIVQITKLIVLFVVSFGVVMYAKENLMNILNKRVDAAGSLTFDIGVANGQPIFTFSNIVPGFSAAKTIKATNNDTVVRKTGVKGVKTSGEILEQGLTVQIRENGNVLYGPKTLSEFFIESQTPNGIPLSSLNSEQSTNYEFIVLFDTSAGNIYQNKSLTFDLQFGIVSEDIPSACAGIKFSKVIYGTAGNDRITGTVGNDLIMGFEGNDSINSGVGNDCIVSGAGNDIVQSGVGSDLVVGGLGDDKLYGDVGNDEMWGSEGDDQLWGGVGNDTIDGGIGNDTMDGDVGNDVLIGGEGVDSAIGAVGRDRCIAETKKTCEL